MVLFFPPGGFPMDHSLVSQSVSQPRRKDLRAAQVSFFRAPLRISAKSLLVWGHRLMRFALMCPFGGRPTIPHHSDDHHVSVVRKGQESCGGCLAKRCRCLTETCNSSLNAIRSCKLREIRTLHILSRFTILHS